MESMMPLYRRVRRDVWLAGQWGFCWDWLPTGFFAWLLGFDAIKKRINGRVWCSDANEIRFDVKVTSSGGSSRYSDTLICRKDGAVVRTIGDLRMTAMTIGVSFLISVLLLTLLVVVLRTYSRLRRRRQAM